MLGNHLSSTINRIRAAEALKTSEVRYRALFEGVNDAVIIHDLDGRFLEVNEVASKSLGYNHEEFLGMKLGDICSEVDQSLIEKRLKKMLRTGQNIFEVTHVAKDGTPIETEVNARLIELGGEKAIFSVCRDIRERKRRERRLAALNRYASELASAGTLDQIWDTTIKALSEGLSHQFAGIGVISGTLLKYIRYLGFLPPDDVTFTLDGPGITIRAIRTGKTQLVKDITKDADFRTFIDEGNFQALSELAVPIRIGSKPSAVINVESTHLDAFDENDQMLLEILAEHVGQSIDRIENIQQLEAAESQMAALHVYTAQLAEAQTFDETAKVTADTIMELLDTSNGSLSLVEGGALHFRYLYGSTLSEEFVLPLDGTGITVRAAVTGASQLVPDVTKDASYVALEEANSVTRSELAVPVKLKGAAIAVINVESPTVNTFTKRDQRLLEVLAAHLSSAFARIREEEAREKYQSRLEALHTLVARLDTVQTIDQIAAITSDMVQHLFGMEHGVLALVEGSELVKVMAPGITGHPLRLPLKGRGVTVRVVNEGRTVYVQDTGKDPDFIDGGFKALSELVVPLRVKDKVVGVLNLESQRRNSNTPEDIRLAETLALHISGTLTRINLAEEQQRALETALRQEAAAERAQELATVKTRFLSSATHEIRTPLTSIGGYTDLIQNALQSGDISQLPVYFDAVKRNTERLTRLTNDLLDTQRIEEGRMIVSRTPVKTGDLLRDFAQEATPGLTRRGQTLEVRDELDAVINVDRDRMIQVLANLVNNASKFSPQGSTIHLRVEKRSGGALFTVRDHGVGLAEGDIPKLFKPFPGIHVGGNKEGSGLGLSICRGIVELHGGRIWGESEGPGKGSTLSFTIPEVTS
jgi:PAS domain S-box-containing protein